MRPILNIAFWAIIPYTRSQTGNIEGASGIIYISINPKKVLLIIENKKESTIKRKVVNIIRRLLF